MRRNEWSKSKAQPGDLLVHDAMTIHLADKNRSSRSRKAIGFIYYAASAKVDEAAFVAALQQKLVNDLRERIRSEFFGNIKDRIIIIF